jgi:hypothetical protein
LCFRTLMDRLRPRVAAARYCNFASASPAKRTPAVSQEDGDRIVVGLRVELARRWGDDVLLGARGCAGEGRCGESARGGACCLRFETVRHASPWARLRTSLRDRASFARPAWPRTWRGAAPASRVSWHPGSGIGWRTCSCRRARRRTPEPFRSSLELIS